MLGRVDAFETILDLECSDLLATRSGEVNVGHLPVPSPCGVKS